MVELRRTRLLMSMCWNVFNLTGTWPSSCSSTYRPDMYVESSLGLTACSNLCPPAHGYWRWSPWIEKGNSRNYLIKLPSVGTASQIIRLIVLGTYFASLDPRPPSWGGRPGIDCLRMREVFRILSSKFDRKLNYPWRAVHPHFQATFKHQKVDIIVATESYYSGVRHG